jgi:hypothetical protein
VNHVTLFGELGEQRHDISGGQILLPTHKKKHVCDFEDRTPCRVEKIGKVNIGCAARTLGNIVGDAEGSCTKLLRKR